MQHLTASSQKSMLVAQDLSRASVRAEQRTQLTSVVPRSRASGSRQRGALVTVNSLATETNPAPEKYDYILVGAGSAGSILANRLSADPSKKVLILEAGGSNDSVNVRMPAGITRLFKSELDWNLYTNRQEAVNGRRLYLARGKMVGGSSSSNATLYSRGSREDYDSWKMPGWTSQEALHYFIQCEDNHEGAKEGVHGVGGNVKIENPRYYNPMHDALFEAAKQAGLPYNPDFNDWGHSQEGYGEFQVYHDNGERADMYRQYLKPVQDRGNLTLLTSTRTLKVVLEKRGARQAARGVQFNSTGPDGVYHTAELTAEGEVIMCAGAVHTPHLLSLSGIGAGKQLRQYDVPVAVDLPGVGQNLQDHPACLTAWQATEELREKSQLDEMLNPKGKVRPKAILNYLLRRRGPLTSSGCDHGAFLSTRGDGHVDLQVRMVPAMALDPDGVNSYVAMGKAAKEGKRWPSGYTLQMLAIRAKSKGTVQLRSDDPFDAPLIDAKYLTDADGADLNTLREGLKFSRRLTAQEGLASITDREMHPGTNVQSDSDIDEYIRNTLHSGNAVVGTCAMGQDPRQGAVVDGELRVHGTDGLRVVDASIIPILPGAQTGAAAIMVAERAAAMLTAKPGPKQSGNTTRKEPALAGV